MMPLSFYIDLLKDKWIRRRYLRQSIATGKGTVILMFHHVADSCPEGVSLSCYSSIKDFEQLIDMLIGTKEMVSMTELCDELESGVIPVNKVVITFDDVPANVYENAIPFLRKYSVPYTLYISTGLIGTEGFMSEKQIKELSKDPLCTIGSHTVSHSMLKKNNVDLQKEFLESKQELERLIKSPVEHFAYPYGTPFAISNKVIKYLQNSGLYRSAVCTIPACINRHSIDNMFSLPRIHSQLFINNYLNKK